VNAVDIMLTYDQFDDSSLYLYYIEMLAIFICVKMFFWLSVFLCQPFDANAYCDDFSAPRCTEQSITSKCCACGV